MSNNHSEHLSQKQNQLEGEGFLPPRHTRHGKRKDEETEEEMEREKSFPLIQIVLYTFLAIIAAFLIFWFWQENQTAPSSNTPSKASQEESLQEDQDDSTSGMNGVEEDHSKETTSDLNDKDEHVDEERSEGGAGEGSGEGTEQDLQEPADESSDDQIQSEHDAEGNQNSQKPGQYEESKDTQEPTGEPKIMAEHIVQPGETLYSITMKYYHSKKYMEHIAEYNGIKDTRNIEAGVKLIIPEKP